MQERILKSILPHWNITFLPLNVDVTSLAKSKWDAARGGLHEGRGRNCTRCCQEEEKTVGEKFLGVLGFILDNSSNPWAEACISKLGA